MVRPARNLCLTVPGPSMGDALRVLASHAPQADLVELRLDLIADYDLAALLRASPRPAIATLRAAREGGAYEGDEARRLAELRRAAGLGAAWVDVELDAWQAVGPLAPARKIVSHHHFGPATPDVGTLFHALERTDADAIKLAVAAAVPTEGGRLLGLFGLTARPAVILGMGEAGVATRLLCLRYDNCLLTFVAAEPAQATAPGQLTLGQAESVYRARTIGPKTAAIGCLVSSDAATLLKTANAELARHGWDAVCVPLGTTNPRDGIQALDALGLVGALIEPELEITALQASARCTEAATAAGRANLICRNVRGEWIGDFQPHLAARLSALLRRG